MIMMMMMVVMMMMFDVMMTVYNHTPMINSSIITCDNVILTQ